MALVGSAAAAFARHHRLRRTPALRRLVRETRLDPSQLVLLVFVDARLDAPVAISALPGHMRWPVSDIARQAERAAAAKVGGLLLFGLPQEKDHLGRAAADPLRAAAPDLALIADVCLCEYTTHGHCGALDADGAIDNDATLPLLADAAVAYADAGADVLAPSDMMDGRVAALRGALDREGHAERAILSYAAKFASAYYGPFREAAECAPQSGDRNAYQLDPPNGREAMAELRDDLAEGADLLMVKPAGPYLDIVAAARARYDVPIAAYQVSGEYAALHAAAERGWIDLPRAALESVVGIARAGAGVIVTYFALDAAAWLAEDRP